MTKRAVVGFLLGLFGVVGIAVAADPSGTWKVTSKFKDKEIEQTLKIEVKDGKVTGTISGGKDKEGTKIEDGKFKDNEISFTVTREGKNNNKFVTKYTGKVSDDNIKGEAVTDFNGKEFKRAWQAKREKAKD